jgi:glycosyltransferase involved in cell wall biosynthesis
MISNKVTHLITTIERGGAEKQLLTLTSEQVQSGLKVVVLYLKGKPDLRNEFEESGVEVNDLLIGKSFLKQIFLLSKYLRKNPSPVHAHLPKSELLAAIVITRKYFVFSRHNSEPFWSCGPRIISNLLSKFVCKRASQGIAISNAVRSYLIKQGEIPNGYTVDVVYYGFQKDISTNSVGMNLITNLMNGRNSNYKIGTIGRLVPQKDYPTLLSAFSNVLESVPNIELYVVGEGYLQKDLIELSDSLGINDNVHWLGKTEYINEFLSKLDLFILPSKYEGFGLVLLEAMVAKKPIIAANNSALPEVLGKTYEGLFSTGDVNALAQQIKTVIDDNNLSERLVQSYLSQLELFDPSKMNKNIENVYSNTGF